MRSAPCASCASTHPQWQLDANRVGVLGFSAGGHLVAVLGAHAADAIYPAVDDADKLSARPDFTLLIYPGYLESDDTRYRPPGSKARCAHSAQLSHPGRRRSGEGGERVVYYEALKQAKVRPRCISSRTAAMATACGPPNCPSHTGRISQPPGCAPSASQHPDAGGYRIAVFECLTYSMISHLSRRTAFSDAGIARSIQSILCASAMGPGAALRSAARNASSRDRRRHTAGGFRHGRIDLSDDIIVKRIEMAAHAVVTYYGNFPVPRVRIFIVPMADAAAACRAQPGAMSVAGRPSPASASASTPRAGTHRRLDHHSRTRPHRLPHAAR